jgi:hypothetical protein
MKMKSDLFIGVIFLETSNKIDKPATSECLPDTPQKFVFMLREHTMKETLESGLVICCWCYDGRTWWHGINLKIVDDMGISFCDANGNL